MPVTILVGQVSVVARNLLLTFVTFVSEHRLVALLAVRTIIV